MKITLKRWAAENFDPAPCVNTLRNWVKQGRIAPAPVFIGRAYWVEATARYIEDRRSAPPRPDLRKGNRLIDRIAAGSVTKK